MMSSYNPLYIEISPLLASPLAGIGRFAARLIESLSRLTPLRLVNLAGDDLAASLKLSNALRYGQEIRMTDNNLPAVGADLDLWVRWLLQRRHHNLDFQSAGQCPGLFTMLRPSERHFRREVCILYDFTPVILPRTHVLEIRNQFGRFFSETSRLCDKAVAISESTKADASWLCAIPKDDVIVSYPGPSLCVESHAFTGPVKRRNNLILVVSTLEPRKNGQFLLDWFSTTDVLQPGTQLWWVGPKGWLSDLFGQNRKLESRRSVRFLGMVPDKRLCELYRQAAFTIYPSLYEGFGLPMLDSLLHGAPVVSSFNSSLQEFAGEGVYYFDAYDAASLDAACGELLETLPLQIDRTDLHDRFSWDRLAQTVMSLCR
jgi:glycosyltransferase involved in cell wall biosynthesis